MVIYCVQFTVMCIEFAVMTFSQCRRSHFHVNIGPPRASARPGSGYYLFAKLIARPSRRPVFLLLISSELVNHAVINPIPKVHMRAFAFQTFNERV